MDNTAPASPRIERMKDAPLGASALIIALITLAAMLGNVVAWLAGLSHIIAGIIFWFTIPTSAAGVLLALISLIRGERARVYSHYGLWINGVIFIIAVPLAMGWMLYFKQ